MINQNQDHLKLYFVSNDYLDYLREIDHKIPLNKQGGKPRPFVGIILSINGNNYFAPLSSQKHNKRTDFKIVKSNEHIATIRCSFMFPIHKNAIKEIDFTEEMNKDRKYTAILIHEINYINNDEHKEKLLNMASKTYEYCTNKKFGYENFCCNFTSLEEHAKAYGTKDIKVVQPSYEELLEKITVEQIKKDFPEIPQSNLQKIESLKNYLLEKYPNNYQAQYEILEKIHSQLPEIASGKIALPDISKGKEKGR